MVCEISQLGSATDFNLRSNCFLVWDDTELKRMTLLPALSTQHRVSSHESLLQAPWHASRNYEWDTLRCDGPHRYGTDAPEVRKLRFKILAKKDSTGVRT